MVLKPMHAIVRGVNMENENDDIMESSMQDKMIKMHMIAFEIENIMTDSNKIGIDESNIKINADEMDLLYCILDGLTEKFIMDRMTGHCSLKAMLDNPPEKLESIIDTDIEELIKINDKYNLKIDINSIDNKIATMQ